MGASKAGVSVVVFDEKDNCDALHSVLKDSGVRGMLYSPSTVANDDGETRQTFLQKLMPDLEKMYPGDQL